MKKVLSLLVVLSMLLSILPATVSATHWADEDVKYLVKNGAIAEDDTMLDNLDTPITRSQMVKIIVALLDGDEPIEGKEYFTDISPDDTHIAKAAENGFVNGFGDGTFRPNNPITRQDFFTIVGRAYELTGEATKKFTDADSIADYAKPYVDALQSIGIVNGYGDGTVNPRGNITIAETLAVMHRTDVHIESQKPEEQPKEEEKPKPKPSGGSSGGGGGYVGGGSSTPSIKCYQRPSVLFDVERTEDYSNGVVAYVTARVETTISQPISRKILLRGGIDTNYIDVTNVWQAAENNGLSIPEVQGKFAVPDFGTYTLYVISPEDNAWGSFELAIAPPESEDATAPEITLEVPEQIELPLTVKVSATDDVELSRLNYVKNSGIDTYEKEIGNEYKIHVGNRQDITDDSFTITEAGAYSICAMDTSGNCAYANVTVGEEQSAEVNYSSELAGELPMKDVCNSTVALAAIFTMEREKDFTGENIAYIKADIVNRRAPSVKKLLLKDSLYMSGAAGGIEYIWDVAERGGQVIYEKEGKFAIPDFGKYVLYVQDGSGIWDKFKFEVKAPKTDDMVAPKLDIELMGEDEFPLTLSVSASDDAGIARIIYVKAARISTGRSGLYEQYKISVNGRRLVTEDTITITEKDIYLVCAMDNNGNCTYRAINAGRYTSQSTTISSCEHTYEFDDEVPQASCVFMPSDGNTQNITVSIGDNEGVVECGYFRMEEYYKPDTTEPVNKRGFLKIRWNIDMSKDIEDLLQYEELCGGIGAIHILKNYFKAIEEGSGVEILPIEGDTLTITENGTYFMYAKDAVGNLRVSTFTVSKIKK